VFEPRTEDEEPTTHTVARLARLQVADGARDLDHPSLGLRLVAKPGLKHVRTRTSGAMPLGGPAASPREHDFLDDSSVGDDGRFWADRPRVPLERALTEANRSWEDRGVGAGEWVQLPTSCRTGTPRSKGQT